MTVAQDSGLRWLTSLPRFGIRPGLSRTLRVLEALGHPEDHLKFFHVAGTNGKGSVCSYLHSLLTLRQTVGIFTSPAYDGFRARFRIGQESIGSDEFSELAQLVMRTSEQVTATDPITEFEALTLMALLYFSRRQVQAVVWETGLGGRYDSTNVVTPVVSAITNVGMDHTEILGNTIRAIASDKAGIIKPGIPVVSAATDAAAWEIRAEALQVGAAVYSYGAEFGAVRECVGNATQRFSYRGMYHDVYGIQLSLFGGHQCINAAVALAMYEIACEQGHADGWNPSDIRQGMNRTRWPGRFERIHLRGIPIVLDGAHNADGARAFARALSEFGMLSGYGTMGWTMVVGMLADKDVRMMLHPLLPLAHRIITVTPDNPRAMPAHELADVIRSLRPDLDVVIAPCVAQGIEGAVVENNGEPLCCWGSLYTVDAARHALCTTFGVNLGTTG